MITSITTRGFKGRDGTTELGPRTMIIGPNGSGKSTLSQALLLVALGYVPGTGKRSADILDAFGDGKSLSAVLTLDNGKTLGRGLTRQASGAVSASYRVGERTAKKTDFEQALGRADLRVVDLAAFLAQSGPAQVQAIFSLFPPSGDLAGLEQQIETATAALNRAEREQKAASDAAARNRAQRSRMELPGRTLAETRDEIAAREKEKDAAQKALTLAEDAERRAKEAARAAEAEKKAATPPTTTEPAQDKAPSAERPAPRHGLAATPAAPTSFPANPAQAQAVEENLRWVLPTADQVCRERDALALAQMRQHAHAAITAILNALDRAGCTACAARLVALRELKKFALQAPAQEAAEPDKEAANA